MRCGRRRSPSNAPLPPALEDYAQQFTSHHPITCGTRELQAKIILSKSENQLVRLDKTHKINTNQTTSKQEFHRMLQHSSNFSSRITAPHGGKTRFFSRGTAPAALTMCTSPPRRSATAFSPTRVELLGQGSATAGRWVSWVKALSSDGKPWKT